MTLRPALRMARRDVRRAPGRSLLIALMVALPVAGSAFVDVLLRTAQVVGAEQVPLQLGRAADARLLPQSTGSPVVQEPDGLWGSAVDAGTSAEPASTPRPPVDPRTLLPPGTRAITDQRGEVQVRTTSGLARAVVRELAYTDPLAQGLVRQDTGRPPRAPGEVVVSPALLDVLGLAVGDRLQVTRPKTSLAIVGTARPVSGEQGAEVAFTLPGAVLDSDELAYVEPQALLVDTPAPVDWDAVLALNERGVVAFSRAVVLDPPPREAVPYYSSPQYGSGGSDMAPVVAAVLVVGLVVLEVALLAGAAFAVGIRRQSRALGLLAATGARAGQVRAVVLAQGVVLGVLGGVVGVVVGLAAGAAAVLVANRRFDAFLPALDVRPLELVALALIGLLTGLLAASLPARTAARQDVVAALTGRRGVVRTRRRLPVLGLVTTAVGVVLAIGGGAWALALQRSGQGGGRALSLVAAMILVGAVLTQLGLIVATPALIGGAARLSRFLPLAPRLALRDAARHRGRSAPAVAAILGAVAGSVALTLFVASQSDKDRRSYQPGLGPGMGLIRTISMPGEAPRDPQALVAAVARVAPPDEVFEVRSFPDLDCRETCLSVAVVAPAPNRCPLESVQMSGRDPSPAQFAAAERDPRCSASAYSFSSPFSGPLVGDYAAFVRVTGLRSTTAREALAAGGMVVFDERQVLEGKGALAITTHAADGTSRPTSRAVSVPATYVAPAGHGFVSGFLSPQAARAVGVPSAVEGTIVRYDTPPTDDEEEAISLALERQGEQGLFQVERGYRDQYGVGLWALLLGSAVITLGASGIATGLAQVDARADLATLAAVGAAPRLRRRLTALQAAVVAGLGAVLGTASGFVPTAAFLYADTEMRFVAPWRNLLVIAVVVPAVAALCAGLLTRSRLPLDRRLG